ncbi:MAG: 3-deoxy-D-manno-octulosonic acid transferase [Puniceicoccaceae bacterium]
MFLFYRLLFPFLLVAALPVYLPRMLRRGGYRNGFRQRFGLGWKVPPTQPGRSRIWIQAVSVGEVNAVEVLLDHLSELPSPPEVVITTTTSTGHAKLQSIQSPVLVATGYFPLDTPLATNPAWNAIQPDLFCLFEGEIWPEHLRAARKRAVPALLLNARISDRSFRRWQRFPLLAKRLLSLLSEVSTASPLDQARFQELAPDDLSIKEYGNLKADFPDTPAPAPAERLALGTELGLFHQLSEDDISAIPVIVGVSTWPGEEDLLLETLRALKAHRPEARLLLVPRHAERRREIGAILQRYPFSAVFRSQRLQQINPISEQNHDVAVLDSTGELSRFCRVGTLAFVGKSLFENRGGQSPFDTLRARVPTVFGSEMSNFRSIANSLLAAGAAQEVTEENAQSRILHLVDHPEERRAIVEAGARWLAANRGAAARTAQAISDWLKASRPASS